MWSTVKMTDGFTGSKMQADKVFILSLESLYCLFMCLLKIESEEKLQNWFKIQISCINEIKYVEGPIHFPTNYKY